VIHATQAYHGFQQEEVSKSEGFRNLVHRLFADAGVNDRLLKLFQRLRVPGKSEQEE
jgi:hypothetical protein